MNHIFLSPRPLGAALVGCFGLGLTVGASAAVGDLTLLEDARVSGKFDRRLGAQIRGTRADGEREGLELSTMATIAYDDNIFRTADDEQEDMVTTLTQRVRYTLGQPNGRAWIRAQYEGTGVLYWDNTEESRVDHRLAVKATMRRKMLRLAYAGSWERLGSPDPDVGGSPERSEWNHRVALGWEPRGKTSAEIFTDWSLLDQDASFLNDIEETTFGLSVLHRYSPKTGLGMTYEFGETEIDGSPGQDFQRITGQIHWKPRRKVAITLEGGAEYRDYGTGSTNWEPVFSGRVNWTPRRGTELYLAGYRRQEASAFFDGQNFDVTGAVAGVSQRIYEGWSGRFEVGWEESEYFNTAGGGAGRDDSAVFVRPSVSYLSGGGHLVQLFYQWSDSDSSDPGFGYSNQEIGASIECQF